MKLDFLYTIGRAANEIWKLFASPSKSRQAFHFFTSIPLSDLFKIQTQNGKHVYLVTFNSANMNCYSKCRNVFRLSKSTNLVNGEESATDK
jgi:hypothetical protein